MIRINEDYEAERYTYGWMLHRWRDGENPKTKEPTRNCRTTYYNNLSQLCDAVIDDAAGGANDARQLQQIVSNAQADMKLALSPNAEAQLPPEQAKPAEGTESAAALWAVNCSDLLGDCIIANLSPFGGTKAAEPTERRPRFVADKSP